MCRPWINREDRSSSGVGCYSWVPDDGCGSSISLITVFRIDGSQEVASECEGRGHSVARRDEHVQKTENAGGGNSLPWVQVSGFKSEVLHLDKSGDDVTHSTSCVTSFPAQFDNLQSRIQFLKRQPLVDNFD